MELSRFPIHRTHDIAPAILRAVQALPPAHLDHRAEVSSIRIAQPRGWQTMHPDLPPMQGILIRFARVVGDAGARWQLAEVIA